MSSNIMDNILEKIETKIPDFNDYLLKGFRRYQFRNCFNFIETVFKESIKVIDDNIEYLGYRIVPPEERTEYELKYKIINKSLVNIKRNEIILLEYMFRYNGTEFSTKLYLPYLIEDCVIIEDTHYHIHFILTDKIFSKSRKCITIRTIRSPIKFYLDQHIITPVDLTGVGEPLISYPSYIFSVKLHHNKSKGKNAPKTSVLHYLIGKYGLINTMKIFNINTEEFKFIYEQDATDSQYLYFRLNKSKNVVIRTTKDFVKDDTKLKFLANIHYILSFFKIDSIDYLYEPQAIKWKIWLGKIIYGMKTYDAKALNNVQKHYHSLDTYVDPLSSQRYEQFGLSGIKTIYDMLVYIFVNGDNIIANFNDNDMFNKRVDTLDQIFIDTIVSKLFNNVYRILQRSSSKNKEENYRKIFNINAREIKNIYEAQNVNSSPSIYNDNMLFNYLSKLNRPSPKTKTKSGKSKKSQKVKMSKVQKEDNKFNLSIAFIESLIGYSSSNPTKSSTINPFVEIDIFGGFIEPEIFKTYRRKYGKYFT